MLRALAGGLVLFGAIQLIPYGRNHVNPPDRMPFRWSSPQAEALARVACYDCHSHETRWWWAVEVAPFSWLAQHDIDDARRHLNFSDWSKPVTAQRIRTSLDRGMPPIQFTLFHADARLTAAQKQTLAEGFEASLPGNSAGSNQTAEPSPSDAVAIILARCNDCHSTAAALKYRGASPEQASGLLAAMVKRGARLSASERQTLLARFTS